MVEAKSLCMNYGTTRALVEASFVAADNQVMGLLGPNGAGKTTCMKIITTQMVPTSGTAEVAGLDVQASPIEVRKKVGYLPETAPLYNDMEVAEFLEFVGNGRGLTNNKLKSRIDWVVEACKVKGVYRRPIGELSRGYRQRVGLAQALIHDPEVLILDEPTSGLDPLQIVGIRQLIKDLSATKTIIFSTHILQEVEAISDKIVIINEGRIIADGTPDDLRLSTGETTGFTIELKASRDEIQGSFSDFGTSLELEFVGGDNDFNKFVISGADYTQTQMMISEKLKSEGWQVREFSPNVPNLEKAFIQLTKERRTHE
ncbi:MAG: ATP-binding cassette domain-containing protein [candidate division Zixibacteria bacterium]|nr:ATP-binding cassette domain-containing protein [candidate division Zixibacteria bacterium]